MAAGSGDMDLDDSSPVVSHSSSIKSGKRSYSAMSSESGQLMSLQASGSTLAVLLPLAKKVQRGLSSRGSEPKSLEQGSNSARLADKITPASAVVGMQGSINRLTDIFEKSMLPSDDPAVTHRGRAIQHVQEAEDELSIENKVALILMFMKDNVVVDTYLSLTDIQVRRAWISHLLNIEL